MSDNPQNRPHGAAASDAPTWHELTGTLEAVIEPVRVAFERNGRDFDQIVDKTVKALAVRSRLNMAEHAVAEILTRGFAAFVALRERAGTGEGAEAQAVAVFAAAVTRLFHQEPELPDLDAPPPDLILPWPCTDCGRPTHPNDHRCGPCALRRDVEREWDHALECEGAAEDHDLAFGHGD